MTRSKSSHCNHATDDKVEKLPSMALEVHVNMSKEISKPINDVSKVSKKTDFVVGVGVVVEEASGRRHYCKSLHEISKPIV